LRISLFGFDAGGLDDRRPAREFFGDQFALDAPHAYVLRVESLFGAVENLSGYDNWNKTHAEEFNNFTTFQKTRIFKVPQGQYYQGK